MAALFALTLASATPAVADAGQKPAADKDKDTSITMDGCVARGGTPHDPMTFADNDSGIKYRLSGKSVKKYAGQKVQLIGIMPVPKRVSVRGGLFPSPNVAAQAGAIDPVKAAVARQPGGSDAAAGAIASLPEFRVNSVRVIEGACE
jgi:hypothetical protein